MASAQPQLPEGIGDHRAFQQRFWAAQRVAWVVFATILAGCLLGAFGRGGYLSRTQVASVTSALDYPAITRWNAPDNLEVTFAPSAEDRAFFVDGRFFDIFSIEGIDPPQKSTMVRKGFTGYVFPSDPSIPTRVVFRLQTQMPGFRSATFGADGDVAERTILVFP